MGRKSRNKGKRGELELSKELTRLFSQSCRRGQQYSGIEGDDVVGLEGVHIECKRVEALRLYPSVEQAQQDASEDEVPVVMTRRNRGEWLCVVRLEDLPQLCRTLGEWS